MVNRLILQGRFTQTPELRSTLSGINVVRFTLASQRDKAGQNGEREADFIQCVAWRGTAEFICRYFTKGQSAVIEGAVRSKKWVEDDKTRYGTEVEVSEIHFCGSKKEGTSSTADAVPLPASHQPQERQLPFSGGQQAESGDAPLSTKTGGVFVEEDERQSGLRIADSNPITSGAREDEGEGYNGGWPAPGENAFSLGDVDDLPY